jgi:large subunit ribosomal protein L17
MVSLGWLVANRGWLKKEDEVSQPAEEHDDHSHNDHPAMADRATHITIEDDLTIIEGIGPKVAKLLAGIGISSFADLAKSDYSLIRKTLDEAGYKYMEPTSWFDQAELAAKGDAEGLKKLQESLKGGRKVN